MELKSEVEKLVQLTKESAKNNAQLAESFNEVKKLRGLNDLAMIADQISETL